MLDAEHGPGDLLADRNQALADLDCRGVHLDAGRRYRDPGIGVVVEALGKRQVLGAHRVADTSHSAGPVRREAGAPREMARDRRWCRRGGSGISSSASSTAVVGNEPFDYLTGGRERLTRLQRVQLADLHRIHAELLGEEIHLALGAEVGLHDAEAPHGAVGRVVRLGGVGLDEDVVADIRTDREIDRVAHHGRRRVLVGATVEHHPGIDADQLAVGIRFVAEPHPRRVAMDVSHEGLAAIQAHLHRPADRQRHQAEVDLQRDVLAGAEGSTHSDRMAAHLLGLEAQTGIDLLVVDVDPLTRRPEIDAALTVGNGQAGLGPQRRLVLAADDVLGLDHDRARVSFLIASPHVRLS